MSKILYTNGDSFTAGAELALEMILPKQAAETRYGIRVNPITARLRDAHNAEIAEIYRQDTPEIAAYDEECKRRAWPNKLGKILGYDVVNAAKSGESNGHIAHTTIKDVTELLKHNAAEDLFVVVMITGMDRILIPFYDETRTVILGYDPDEPTMKQFRKMYLEHANDEFLFLETLNYVYSIENFLYRHKIRHCFVDSVLFKTTIRAYLDTNTAMYGNLPKVSYCMWDILEENPTEQWIMYGGHFDERLHEIFAERIANDFNTGKL